MQDESDSTEHSAPAIVAPRPLSKRERTAVLLSFTLSGAAALIYEVAWTRELSLVFGSTVYAVSMMLTAFMSGLALGSFLGGRRADRSTTDLIVMLAKIEFMIGIFGMLSTPIVRGLPSVYFWINQAVAPPLPVFFAIQFIFSFLVMIVPTTLMGATFPVVSKISVRSYKKLGETVGDVYTVNTLGSVAGSAAAGFLLIPLLGVAGAVLTAATLNLLASTLLVWLNDRPNKVKWAAAAAAVLLIGYLSTQWAPTPAYILGMESFNRYASYDEYVAEVSNSAVLYRQDDAYGRVVVTEDPQGARTLRHGGLIEGSNLPIDEATTGLLAALPYAYNTDAKSVAVIGLGTGYTTLGALRLPVESVETIEINAHMDDAARYFVGDQLHADPRWRLTIDDARSQLASNVKRYDIITSEPSWPLSSSVASLFSKEFFEISKARLEPGGVFIQWLPGYLLSDDDVAMMYKTFASVYPDAQIWGIDDESMDASELFLVGVNGPVDQTTDQVHASIKSYLAQNGLQDIAISGYEVTDEMRALTSDPTVPMNTDDQPRLEFSVAQGLVENFRVRTQLFNTIGESGGS